MFAFTPETAEQLAKLTAPHLDRGVEVPSLLDQLKDALFQGMETGSAGSAFGSRLPLAAGAFDLYRQIEDESAALIVGAPRQPGHSGREYGLWGQFTRYDATAKQQLPTQLTEDSVNAFTVRKWRYAFSSPAENIGAWAETLATEFQGDVAAKIITRWVNMITALLYPETGRLEFLDSCPKCGARYFFDGTTGIRSAAVHIIFPDGVARADCRSCGEAWLGGREVLRMKFESELKSSKEES